MFRAAFRRLLAIDDPPERTALAFSIGIFIAFAPVRVMHLQLSHLEILSTQWLHLSLYFLHRMLDTPRWRWAVGLAVTFWLIFITSAYLGYFFLIYAAIFILYDLLIRRDLLTRRFVIAVLVAALIAALLLLPFYAFRYTR